jgi:methionyl-tRNA formyltransferase
MKINILIDKNSWAANHKNYINNSIKKIFNNAQIYHSAGKIKINSYITIFFSYFKIVKKSILLKSKYNLIVHESNLPKGRGMSPISWQILEGKNEIYFSLIEASEKMDKGNIYYKKKVYIKNNLLFKEIKKIQLTENLKLILKFLKFIKKNKKAPKSRLQKGKATYYKKRNPKDSVLNINKNLKSQFNLLRICDNEKYPLYFNYRGRRYILRINANE